MRKLLLAALAGLALGLAAPVAGSAAPVMQGEAMTAASENVGGVQEVQHRRRFSRHGRWESRRRWHSRWESRRRWHSRWESRRRWR
jgi:hypothetical protein